MIELFDAVPLNITLAQGFATGTFRPALHVRHPQLAASSTLLERYAGGYLLHGHQFISVSPRIRAQGIRIQFDVSGQPMEASVQLDDGFYPATLDLYDLYWAPEYTRMAMRFDLVFRIGHKNHWLTEGQVDLALSHVLELDA